MAGQVEDQRRLWSIVVSGESWSVVSHWHIRALVEYAQSTENDVFWDVMCVTSYYVGRCERSSGESVVSGVSPKGLSPRWATRRGAGRIIPKSLATGGRMCNVYYIMKRTNKPQTITETLRQAIADSEIPFLQLEKKTGVLRQSLMKFARGEQSLMLDAADRLAEFFDLEMVERKGK